jgi:hypothetical protein
MVLRLGHNSHPWYEKQLWWHSCQIGYIMPAAEQSCSHMYLCPPTPSESELSSIPRDLLSGFVFNRSTTHLQKCLLIRGMDSHGTAGSYMLGALLMSRTCLYPGCFVKMWTQKHDPRH